MCQLVSSYNLVLPSRYRTQISGLREWVGSWYLRTYVHRHVRMYMSIYRHIKYSGVLPWLFWQLGLPSYESQMTHGSAWLQIRSQQFAKGVVRGRRIREVWWSSVPRECMEEYSQSELRLRKLHTWLWKVIFISKFVPIFHWRETMFPSFVNKICVNLSPHTT